MCKTQHGKEETAGYQHFLLLLQCKGLFRIVKDRNHVLKHEHKI